MSLKSKRVTYSDADCHSLVDIVYSYKNIVECKKTDATTWKQKIAIWEKITQAYNAATTEPRTAEQLRCKYDNLKQEVRKYEARKRQNFYRTGGDMEPDVKASIQLLYEKIKSAINFSVKGLDPVQGNSDVVVGSDDVVLDIIDTGTMGTSEAEVPFVIPENKQIICDVSLPNTSQPQETNVPEINNTQDWSDYTPKMLKSKKHKVLQVKRRKVDNHNYENTDGDFKTQMFHLKKELLEKEDSRNEEYHYHAMKMKKEELYNYKINNLRLQNEKLELEINILKKQLG